jgi:hypothetical protein
MKDGVFSGRYAQKIFASVEAIPRGKTSFESFYSAQAADRSYIEKVSSKLPRSSG